MLIIMGGNEVVPVRGPEGDRKPSQRHEEAADRGGLRRKFIWGKTLNAIEKDGREVRHRAFKRDYREREPLSEEVEGGLSNFLAT